MFVFEAETIGLFTVVYVEDIFRLTLSPNSIVIRDLAGNSPVQVMDVLPVIYEGRTLLPLRFVANALAAQVDWTPATDYRQMLITIYALNGESLTFEIGEMVAGMDVPAKIITNY